MSERTEDDFKHERSAIDAAHVQNEAGRDAFTALAHTALFASSVAFVGDVAPLAGAIWKPALITGWLASVIGLLALTFSFGAARRSIDVRRSSLNDPEPSEDKLCEYLNATALWSFPVALLCLFAFVTANVVSADVRQAEVPAARPSTHKEGSSSAAKGAIARHWAGGRSASPSCTEPDTASSAKEVIARHSGRVGR